MKSLQIMTRAALKILVARKFLCLISLILALLNRMRMVKYLSRSKLAITTQER